MWRPVIRQLRARRVVTTVWKLDFSAFQTISCQIDRYRHHHDSFAPFDIDLTAGNIDAQLALRNQLTE